MSPPPRKARLLHPPLPSQQKPPATESNEQALRLSGGKSVALQPGLSLRSLTWDLLFPLPWLPLRSPHPPSPPLRSLLPPSPQTFARPQRLRTKMVASRQLNPKQTSVALRTLTWDLLLPLPSLPLRSLHPPSPPHIGQCLPQAAAVACKLAWTSQLHRQLDRSNPPEPSV